MTDREPSGVSGDVGSPAKRYRVMVFAGSKGRPVLVRQIGWFPSYAAGEAWCEREGLSRTPAAGEWAVVAPSDEEIAVQPPERDA